MYGSWRNEKAWRPSFGFHLICKYSLSQAQKDDLDNHTAGTTTTTIIIIITIKIIIINQHKIKYFCKSKI